MLAQEYPVLSFAERDRRFALAREFMATHDLDGLVLGQVGARVFQYFFQSQQYLSNEPNGQNPIVIFPRDSDPVLIVLRTHWGQIWAEEQTGVAPWIADFRLNEKCSVVDALREKGLDQGRVGFVLPTVAGTAFGANPVGSLADPLFTALAAECPELEAVDSLGPFSMATLAKSEEEMKIARFLGEVSDRAAQAYSDAAKPGGTEIDMYAAAMAEFSAVGVECQNIMMIRGNDMAGMGSPRWLLPSAPIRALAPGDVILNEMFPVYAGIEAQLSLAVHIGDPSADALTAHKACQDAHAACLEAMRPGVTFQQVWQAMFDVVKAAGCWNWTPLIHSLSPMSFVGQQHHDLETREDLPEELRLPVWPSVLGPHLHTPLEEGMLFSVEPGAATGGNRSRTGSLVAVTATGAEELTQVGTRLHVRT